MCRIRILLTVLILATAAGPARTAEQKPKKLPKFDDVKTIVHKELAKHRGYRYNDILTREWVSTVMDVVEKKTDWKIEDRKEITGKFLPNGDYLVRQLRTRKGTTFMRHFSGTRNAFDRADRLRSLPNGERRIPELMDNPGGYTMILYLATTRSGHNMGLYLNQLPGVKNFNKPTGRLYTERQLVDRLKRSYEREEKYRRFGRPKKKAAKKRG